jgi:hypothetical protein
MVQPDIANRTGLRLANKLRRQHQFISDPSAFNAGHKLVRIGGEKSKVTLGTVNKIGYSRLPKTVSYGDVLSGPGFPSQ